MVKRPSDTETWEVRGEEETEIRELDTLISPAGKLSLVCFQGSLIGKIVLDIIRALKLLLLSKFTRSGLSHWIIRKNVPVLESIWKYGLDMEKVRV